MTLTRSQIAHVKNTVSEELGFRKPLVNPIEAEFTKFGGLKIALVELKGFYYLIEIEGEDIFVSVAVPPEVLKDIPDESPEKSSEEMSEDIPDEIPEERLEEYAAKYNEENGVGTDGE